MSKRLAQLLSKSEAEVAKAVTQFEEKTGFPSEDVRFLAESKHKLRTKVAQLGLDPDDTTDKELFYALQARFEKDAELLNKALAVDGETPLGERLNKAIQLADYCASTDDGWFVKNSVAKSQLKEHPPKRVAKKLHYRSSASLIKREDIAEVFLATSVLESATWQKALSKQMAKLNSFDYELRPVRIIKLDAQKWSNISGPNSHIVFDSKMGVVAIWPSDSLSSSSVLSLTLLLLHGLQSINPDGYSESLAHLSPALRWWADNNYLIAEGSQPVSLNLKDVALNHLKDHDLDVAVSHHGAHSLWHELSSRYQQISDSLSETIPNLEYNFDQSKMPVEDEVAAEFALAEE